jgi:hypothetical protein
LRGESGTSGPLALCVSHKVKYSDRDSVLQDFKKGKGRTREEKNVRSPSHTHTQPDAQAKAIIRLCRRNVSRGMSWQGICWQSGTCFGHETRRKGNEIRARECVCVRLLGPGILIQDGDFVILLTHVVVGLEFVIYYVS